GRLSLAALLRRLAGDGLGRGLVAHAAAITTGAFGLLGPPLGLLLRRLGMGGILGLLGAHILGCLEHLVDRPLHVEGALGDVVMLPVDALLEATDRPLPRYVLAVAPGELGGDEERLREEALDLARPRYRLLVLVGELVDPEDGDDVLELLVALQRLLNAGCG